MFIAEKIVAQERVVHECLKNDIEETSLTEVQQASSTFRWNELANGYAFVCRNITLTWKRDCPFQCNPFLVAGYPWTERLTAFLFNCFRYYQFCMFAIYSTSANLEI